MSLLGCCPFPGKRNYLPSSASQGSGTFFVFHVFMFLSKREFFICIFFVFLFLFYCTSPISTVFILNLLSTCNVPPWQKKSKFRVCSVQPPNACSVCTFNLYSTGIICVSTLVEIYLNFWESETGKEEMLRPSCSRLKSLLSRCHQLDFLPQVL